MCRAVCSASGDVNNKRKRRRRRRENALITAKTILPVCPTVHDRPKEWKSNSEQITPF